MFLKFKAPEGYLVAAIDKISHFFRACDGSYYIHFTNDIVSEISEAPEEVFERFETMTREAQGRAQRNPVINPSIIQNINEQLKKGPPK